AFAGGFPFVRQVLPAFPASLHWPGGSFYTQRTVGLLPGVPFTMLYFLAPLAAWLASGENVRSVFRREGLPARAITAGAAAYLSLIVLAELLRGLAVNGILTETALFLGRCGEEIPFAWFLAAAFAALLWKRGLAGPAGEGFPRTAFALLLAPALATFGATLFFNMHTLRYLGDFATPVLLAGGIVWLHFDRQLARDPAAAAALRVIGVALGLCSMGFGVAYAFS
ncbi:MAG TPA: hypothetical protein VL404_05145, partial [Candidatus Eisenbacteria bacterium]|nr:hypothetical protein [Candidatus Eisenbacteria bacterium]